VAVRLSDSLSTVEPERGGNSNGEINWRENAGMVQFVDVGETSVKSAWEGSAGFGKAGLRNGVVGAVEVEGDDVSDGGVELSDGGIAVLLVDQCSISTNDNAVSGNRAARGGRDRVDGGRGGSWWWWKEARCGGCLSAAADCGVDSRCLPVDDCDADVNNDDSNKSLFVDCNNTIFAWGIAGGVDPDRGLGIAIVYRRNGWPGGGDIRGRLVG